jgi:NADPH-dependent F420 reductase
MAAMDLTQLTIAVIPGTGEIGSRLASQYTKAGLSVVVGSRDPARAQKIAAQISREIHSNSVKGLTNAEAAASGDIIFWCASGPLEAREELLKSLASHLVDKIIVDVTNVLYFFGESHWGHISSTLLYQDALGVPARWTTAFKATIARFLREDLPDVNNPHTTFVAGDDPEAVATTIALVETIPGFKGAKAGPLENSRIVELLGPRWMIELDELNVRGRFSMYGNFGI